MPRELRQRAMDRDQGLLLPCRINRLAGIVTCTDGSGTLCRRQASLPGFSPQPYAQYAPKRIPCSSPTRRPPATPGKGRHLHSPECLPLGRPQTEAWGSRGVKNRLAQYPRRGSTCSTNRSKPAMSWRMGFDRMAARVRQRHASAPLSFSRKCL